MEYGFIYAFLNVIIEFYQNYLNPAEWFKRLAIFFAHESPGPFTTRTIKFKSNGVDFYTLIKWLLVLILWIWGVDNFITMVVIWWLILSNLHTFLYYFLWKKQVAIEHERAKRRFVKLVASIFFTDFCFAYLFYGYYHTDFAWTSNYWGPGQSIWFSISNSVAGNYDKVRPINESGYNLIMIQYVITFFYIWVLVSKAIPKD